MLGMHATEQQMIAKISNSVKKMCLLILLYTNVLFNFFYIFK